MTLEELLEDENWAQVFADENDGNVNKDVDRAPPNSDVDISPMTRQDVAEIIASVDGQNDGDDWLGVFLLKDGRYLIAKGACDSSGWGCQAWNQLTVCEHMEDVLQFGLTADEKDRLGLK